MNDPVVAPPPTQGKPPQRWFRLEQFAERYGLSERCLHNWRKEGRIQVIKIGGVRFVDDEHFNSYADQQPRIQ